MTRKQFAEKISSGADIMGVPLDDQALDRLFVYYNELQRWNRKVNLVSRQEHDWVRIHFLDSLAALGLGLLGGRGKIVDLGAGAGFPGLPLKIAANDLFLGMAEASGKKCAWLRHLVRELGLEGAQVMEGRFSDLAEARWSQHFDAAVSRAAAKPSMILDFARPFVTPGGRALIYTTENLTESGLGKVHPYRVPGSKVPSVIWEVEI